MTMNPPEQTTVQPARIPLAPKDQAAEPVVAGFCTAIGWITLLVGVCMIIYGFANTPTSDATINAGFITLFSSAFWFAIARMIKLLAQIAHNTRKS